MRAWRVVVLLRCRWRMRAGAATVKTPGAGAADEPRRSSIPYLKIQTALRQRQHRRACRANAGEIATAATRARRAGDEDRHGGACSWRRPASLPDAREKFGVLSEAIDTYMTGLHLTPPEGVHGRLLPDGAEAVAAGGRDARAIRITAAQMLTCGSFTSEHLLHEAHARQRTRRAAARGSRVPDRRGQPLVSRRLEERAAGPHRVRAPLRAPDVRRVAAPRPRLSSSRCRAPAPRSTDRPTPIARTTGKSCRPTRSSWRCGWNRIGWATCCRR